MGPARPIALLLAVAGSLASAPGAYAMAGLGAAAFAGAVIAPVSSVLTRLVVSSTGAYVVANTDLVAFFLSLRGLFVLALIGVGGAFSAQLVASAGAGVASAGDASPLARTGAALRLVGSRLPALAKLAALKVLGLALRASPFVAIVGVTMALCMRGYDLYYFVNAKPTGFWVALGVVAGVGGAGALVLGFTLAGWALAMPMCLLDGAPPREALRRSREALAGRRRPVLLAMVSWQAGAMITSSVVVGVLLKLAEPVLDREWSSLHTAALVTGVLVVVVGLVSLVGTVLASVGQGVLATRLERPGATPIGGARGDLSVAGPVAGPAPVRRSLKILGLGVAGLVAAASAGIAALELSAEPLAITIAAHRGASARAPENTVAAVALAARVGAPWIEIDVQITRDGAVVVVHDTDLRRIAGGDTRRVADLTREEITSVDAGSWFAPEFANERVPTLEQVIDAAGERSGLFVELKVTGDPGPLARATLEIVRAKGFMGRCVFVSLSPRALEAVRELEPDASIGLIFTAGLGAPELLRGSKVLLNVSRASDPVIARYRRAGTDVFVWTISDADRLAPLALAGVTGVLADDPERMLEQARIIGEMPELERLLLTAREKLRR